MSRLADNLKFLRKLNGLSQQKLAEAVGLNRNHIATYERGIAQPNASNLVRLAAYFGVSAAQFVTTDLERNPTTYIEPLKAIETTEGTIQIELETLIQTTNEFQKIFEGFKAYYDWLGRTQPLDPHHQKMLTDIQNILDILEQLLKTNWKLIEKLV
jgi:transcriptional regulator with XRE-family HTH domain